MLEHGFSSFLAFWDTLLQSFSAFQYFIGGLSAIFAGLSKMGMAGFGMISVPLMAEGFGAKASVGILLPMLVIADAMALVFFRRHANWGIIVRVLPFALAGVLAGYFCMGLISETLLRRVLGIVVLSMLVLRVVVLKGAVEHVQNEVVRNVVGPIVGVIAGMVSLMANAAGPVMTVYLLWRGMKKEEFVGTGAWFFFMVNWAKVPFLVMLGLITPITLAFNIMWIPFIVLGALLGVQIVRKMNQRSFEWVVEGLTALSAVKLLL